ncbi:hypothetical protein V8C44DRAFT_206593 [Trichoderma aethiopicum]
MRQQREGKQNSGSRPSPLIFTFFLLVRSCGYRVAHGPFMGSFPDLAESITFVTFAPTPLIPFNNLSSTARQNVNFRSLAISTYIS